MAKRGRPKGTRLATWRCDYCKIPVAAGRNPVCSNCANDEDFTIELGVSVRWPTGSRRKPPEKPLLVLRDVPGQLLLEVFRDG